MICLILGTSRACQCPSLYTVGGRTCPGVWLVLTRDKPELIILLLDSMLLTMYRFMSSKNKYSLVYIRLYIHQKGSST